MYLPCWVKLEDNVVKIKHATDIPAFPEVAADEDHNGICTYIEGTKAAGTLWTVNLGLGRIPTGIEISRKNMACDVFTHTQNEVEQITDTIAVIKFTANNAKVVLRIY